MTPHANDRTSCGRRAALATRKRCGLVAALGLVAVLTAAAGDGPRVESAVGAVEIASGQPPAWRPVTAGEPIGPGDAIRTGHDGRAELVLGTGTVRLYPNSLLRVPLLGAGDAASERLRLERGRSLFDVLKRRDGRFEVETPEVVVSVKGTRFGVDVADALAQVAVYRGLVGVRGVSQTLAMETLVREGFAAVGGREQPFELMLNGAADPWEGWASGRVEALLQDRAATLRVAPAATSPERLAVAEARRAAHAAAAPEAVEIALARDPALRTRVKALARKRAAADAAGGGPAALAPKLAAPTPELADPSLARDNVADRRALKREIRSTLIESMVAGLPDGAAMGGGSTAAGSANLPLEIDVAGGGVEVRANGSSYFFSALQVTELASGTAALPAPLVTYLEQKGVAAAQLDAIVGQMALLLGN